MLGLGDYFVLLQVEQDVGLQYAFHHFTTDTR
jgi:hypothetical protein